MPTIHVFGLNPNGLDGLPPDRICLIRNADFLAGGERHLRFTRPIQGTEFVLRNNLDELLEQLRNRFHMQRCVVLASGDPLFFGIGTLLTRHFGPDELRIEPAVSSMQLAFARAGLSWQEANLASIHGRDLRSVLLPMLGKPLLGLFTQDGESPAKVARFFLDHGLEDYEAVVGENLGGKEERISRWPRLALLLGQSFSPLNYLILRRDRNPNLSGSFSFPGISDEEFVHPEGTLSVMTHQEVRSVLLGKLGLPLNAGEMVWDIGAGLGTVSVEIALLRPQVEVVAVERDPVRAGFLRKNRDRFGAYNIRVLQGSAPQVLLEEIERPRAVFIGGSGAQMDSILDLVYQRLRPGGCLLGNFVTLENLLLMLQRLREWGWPFEVTEIHIARSDFLAGLTGLKPQRGVFLVRADKPEGPPDG